MNTTPKKVLILGSGGLRIGQAGEFDYSGSQAIKALKEEGIKTVLINPNIATVQTDMGMADELYLEALNLQTVTKVIEKEKPDAILLNVGGQTALNLGLELEESGILAEHNVRVLGTSVESIRLTEDRELFKQELKKIDVKTPRSITANSTEEALAAAREIGYPIMLRAGYSLGGLGSGRINTEEDLRSRAQELFSVVPQILIEEYLIGWKEVEYEIVRDCDDNCIAVCNMENFDPLGVHTGESIVIAPSQTLTNEEYHYLREVGLQVVRHLKIIGECNIQYALNPHSGDYRVIEVNARLSRSSALASKATGYPLAFVATKLTLGKRLHEIANAVTKKTTAFFEPALDYLVVKMPRWDTQKLKAAERKIGTEMKSVGEVMAIGRSFPEAIQKAVRMLNISANGVADYPYEIEDPEEEVRHPTDRRLFAIYALLRKGVTVDELHEMSKIDKWFLHQLQNIFQTEQWLGNSDLSEELLLHAKQMGFSDKMIGKVRECSEDTIRDLRLKHGITPCIKQIDTLAGEFVAETNYLYFTYHGTAHDLQASEQPPILVIGSGPYSIGSSVEFDWCGVNTAKTLRRLGYSPIIINSNPETVSTDYDESDRLFFDEITLERVRDILDFEKAQGTIISVGGQVANNLAIPLANRGYKILGTPATSIDQAEDRKKFSSLLKDLNIDQPEWDAVTSYSQAQEFAEKVGYPVLVRPSYVLSGAAMNIVHSEDQLEHFLREASLVSPDHPVIVSNFISNAKELEMDGVADKGELVIYAISEHVENAGVHSGDATIVLPPQKLYLETIRRAKKITRQIVKALNISGPFNIQFIAKDNDLKVIECNLRASRSFPFVSKVTKENFISIATEVIMGVHEKRKYRTLELDYVGIKTPQFSYSRLKGADPVAHVEMASTGEVACIGDNFLEAFYASWLAAEKILPGKRVLVSICSEHKKRLFQQLKQLDEKGWEIYATEGTHDYLSRNGVATHFLYKSSDLEEPNLMTAIANQAIDLIINIPSKHDDNTSSNGFKIRRHAIDHHVPLITNPQLAEKFLTCICSIDTDSLPVKSLKEYTSV